MSLCHRFKRFWNFYWERSAARGKKPEGAIVKATELSVPTLGVGLVLRERLSDATDTDGRWDTFDAPSHGSSDEFDSQIDELWQTHKQELQEIRKQHALLKTKRILLNRRVSELERMLQADQKNRSPALTSTTECDDLSSEDLEMISEMEEVLQLLEKNQEEMADLERCLEIEIRERTLYPEPAILRSRTLEDEFSKKMRIEGGLRYEGQDKTVRCITHQCLPPPLSLSELLQRDAAR